MNKIVIVTQEETENRRQVSHFFVNRRTFDTIYSGNNYFSAIDGSDLVKNYNVIFEAARNAPIGEILEGRKITSKYTSITQEDFGKAYRFAKENEDKRLEVFEPFMQETAVFE